MKQYIDMNTKLKSKVKIDFEKYVLKLIDNLVFWKTIENVRKQRDIKVLTSEKIRSYLVSEPNNHAKKWFPENFTAI